MTNAKKKEQENEHAYMTIADKNSSGGQEKNMESFLGNSNCLLFSDWRTLNNRGYWGGVSKCRNPPIQTSRPWWFETFIKNIYGIFGT